MTPLLLVESNSKKGYISPELEFVTDEHPPPFKMRLTGQLLEDPKGDIGKKVKEGLKKAKLEGYIGD